MRTSLPFPYKLQLIVTLGCISAGMISIGARQLVSGDKPYKGYSIERTGLEPIYPSGYDCSPLTSLYASWIDVDGSRRDEPHSGVDGGRLGEDILAPAPATVERAWLANWGWGKEGALLLRHMPDDLNLPLDGPIYYSEFDHLNFQDIKHLRAGQRIARGEKVAVVHAPGGLIQKYLPEVHWEVWEVREPNRTRWKKSKHGTLHWDNPTAKLVDPLYLLSLEQRPTGSKKVLLQPYVKGKDYSDYVGFTYILPCKPHK